MKYNCGHEGCDICGGQICRGAALRKIGGFIACEDCIRTAVRIAYDMSCIFGGTSIDVAKPCGDGK